MSEPPTVTPSPPADAITPRSTDSVTVSTAESSSEKGVMPAGQTRFPGASSSTRNWAGDWPRGASSTGNTSRTDSAVARRLNDPYDSLITIESVRAATAPASGTYDTRPAARYALIASSRPLSVRRLALPPTVTPAPLAAAMRPTGTPSDTVIGLCAEESASLKGVGENVSRVAPSSSTVNRAGATIAGAVGSSGTSSTVTVTDRSDVSAGDPPSLATTTKA